MREPAETGLSAGNRRLAIAVLCALAALGPFASCLNPLPEEYPSETPPPAPASTAPVADNPSRQGDGIDTTTDSDDPPAEDSVPLDPSALRPTAPTPPDAGADAGPSDAGPPAISP